MALNNLMSRAVTSFVNVTNMNVFVCFKLAIEKYEEMFPAFSDSRELKLLKVIYFFYVSFKTKHAHVKLTL